MLRNLLILCCLLITVNIFAQQKNATAAASKTDYKSINAPLPPLKVVCLDGRIITNATVNDRANLFVMLFNPICEHCQDQTELLEKNLALLKNSQLLMLAAPMMQSELLIFENKYHLGQYPRILIGLDSNETIEKTFIYQALPQINIYNADRKLIKIFSGNVSMDSLSLFVQ